MNTSIHGFLDLAQVVGFMIGNVGVGGFLTAFLYVRWATGRLNVDNGRSLFKLVVPSGGLMALIVAQVVASSLDLSIYALGRWGDACLLVMICSITSGMLLEPRIESYLTTLKGRRGERQVRKALAKFGIEAVHGLYLPTTKGTRATEIDHVASLPHSLLVIETKNWEGTFKAKANDQEWSVSDKDEKWTKPNPLRQNDVHVDAVRAAFGVPVVGLVVMTNLSRFPDGCPEGVVRLEDLGARLKWLKSHPASVDPSTWAKVVSADADGPEQERLSLLHKAFMGERVGRRPSFQQPTCRACGGTKVTPHKGIQASYSPYLRCATEGCRKNTPYKAPRGWEVRVIGGGLTCVEEDTGDTQVVIPPISVPAPRSSEGRRVVPGRPPFPLSTVGKDKEGVDPEMR